jgi:H/ACA ribonucleoprotein complex non-core subunit NAF1
VLSDGEDDLQVEKENKNFPLKTKDELLLNVSTLELLSLILCSKMYCVVLTLLSYIWPISAV